MNFRYSPWLVAGAMAVALTGCDNPEQMLKEQADQVCACETKDCAFEVLKGPINQKLKEMDKKAGGKMEISEEGKNHKKRMMACIMKLSEKEAK